MNLFGQIKLHANALSKAIDRDPKFFTSIEHYVKRLPEFFEGKGDDPSKEELVLIVSKISEFYKKWKPSPRPTPGVFYVEPRQTSDTSSTVDQISKLAQELSQLSDDDFNRGFDKKPEAIKASEPAPILKGAKVFIVHGHDNAAKETLARFLEKLSLVPIILHEQPNGGRTVIEKFEAHSDVQFAVILMTPDDIASPASDSAAREYRARQNVVLELGYFIGKLGRNKVAALKGASVTVPSDISGVIYVDLDEAGAWKFLLAKELINAGISVDMNRAI